MVRPSQRKEMAKRVVTDQGVSIRLACEAFVISETCYRYQAKLSGDNMVIADWLLRLTTTNRSWGFGLCYLYLRNVKGFCNSCHHLCASPDYEYDIALMVTKAEARSMTMKVWRIPFNSRDRQR